MGIVFLTNFGSLTWSQYQIILTKATLLRRALRDLESYLQEVLLRRVLTMPPCKGFIVTGVLTLKTFSALINWWGFFSSLILGPSRGANTKLSSLISEESGFSKDLAPFPH